jgi:cobalt-precorrin-5B (C1)-methyltransferase
LAGDYIGYSLTECARRDLDTVTIWGMIGKISKLATGCLHTNVCDSQVNLFFLVGIARDCGVSEENLKVLCGAATANHLCKMLPAEMIHKFCNTLCTLAATKCRESVSAIVEIECILSDPQGTILGRADARG